MDIFLGYPSEHRLAAEEVYSFLQSLGHSVWMDTSALIGGVEWRREREAAQRRAKLIIHLCAEEMMSRSGDVNREIKLTLDLIEEQPLGALFSIFVRLSDFHLPVELVRFQYIDKFRDDWRRRLEATIQFREQQLHDEGSGVTKKGEVIRETPAMQGAAELIEIADNEPPDEASARYLRYSKEGIYWEWINSEIAAKALSGYFDAKRAFKIARTDVDPEWLKDQSFSWEMNTEEFYLNGNTLSLRFYTYDYLGGAHPNHYIETFNFVGPEHGKLDVRTLLGNDFGNARRVIDYCERVVLASFEDDDRPEEFHLLNKNDEEEVWHALSQFNLDSKGITFNFSPYVVMAYVFGAQIVIVPWETMRNFLGTAGEELAFSLSN